MALIDEFIQRIKLIINLDKGFMNKGESFLEWT